MMEDEDYSNHHLKRMIFANGRTKQNPRWPQPRRFNESLNYQYLNSEGSDDFHPTLGSVASHSASTLSPQISVVVLASPLYRCKIGEMNSADDLFSFQTITDGHLEVINNSRSCSRSIQNSLGEQQAIFPSREVHRASNRLETPLREFSSQSDLLLIVIRFPLQLYTQSFPFLELLLHISGICAHCI
jgi:hypothetical protein